MSCQVIGSRERRSRKSGSFSFAAKKTACQAPGPRVRVSKTRDLRSQSTRSLSYAQLLCAYDLLQFWKQFPVGLFIAVNSAAQGTSALPLRARLTSGDCRRI